mgnify:CR=1 FL=1
MSTNHTLFLFRTNEPSNKKIFLIIKKSPFFYKANKAVKVLKQINISIYVVHSIFNTSLIQMRIITNKLLDKILSNKGALLLISN